MKRLLRGMIFASTAALIPSAAYAGPPYVTDDPEPTDPGHWEVYGFVEGSHHPSETEASAGFDINYGAAKDLQLTIVLPAQYEDSGHRRAGAADVELAVKYLFAHQHENSIVPDISFIPGLTIPTGGHRFGTGRVTFFLPLWAQKDVGDWSLFGGGGYTINPGPDQRDYWLDGVGLSRALGKRVEIGGEIYREGASEKGGHPFTGVNVGGSYRLNDHWSVLASGGPGIHNSRSEGQYTFYAALKADY